MIKRDISAFLQQSCYIVHADVLLTIDAVFKHKTKRREKEMRWQSVRSLKSRIIKAAYSELIYSVVVIVTRSVERIQPVTKGFVLQRGCVMRKPAFCICKGKDTDQLHSDLAADQHICFFILRTIPLLPKYEISSL